MYRKSKPADIARIGVFDWDPVLEHTIYLKLKTPLTEGKTYAIGFDFNAIIRQNLTFDPVKERSEAVHVSHLGFKPDDPAKLAFLSCWMGTGGGIDYSDVRDFQVVEDANDKEVLSGQLRILRRARESEDARDRNYNQADVYGMDLSGLDTPGTYRVVVKGVGCSYPFEIGDAVWEKAFYHSARSFYHQRSGIELKKPFTDFERPRPFHPDDGVKVFASKTPLMDTGNGLNREDTNFGQLVKGKTSRTVKDAWGAYFDAGDWDRRIQHLISSRYLLELTGLFPDYFTKLSLNIPESGNELPDIVSEALYNIDGYRRMQTRDGGIRGGIESEEHPVHGETSWTESLTVLAYAPGIWSSYLYAGAAAQAAFILKKYKSKEASVYRRSAVAAMKWADKSLAKGEGRKYQMQVIEAQHLAAAELFRLTGDEKWHKLFQKSFIADIPQMPDRGTSSQRQHAAWVYTQTRKKAVNKKVQEQCARIILKEADLMTDTGARPAYKWIKPPLQLASCVFTAPVYAISLARAHVLTKDEKYLKGVVLACQCGAGANPSNLCFTTGLGHESPQHPLHIDSRIQGVKPPPGITVFGPVDITSREKIWGEWAHKYIRPMCTPDSLEWPVIESYWDVFWNPPVCEFTIQRPLAQNAYVWGYLAARK